jgi:pyruvate kinase
VIATLGAVCQVKPASLPSHPPLAAFFEGERLLHQHTGDLFGQLLGQRRVRIMVTLPTEAAKSCEFVRDLIQRGTDCVRINCAHDRSEDWSAMIAHVRQAESEIGHSCKILMDLGGPKPRIGMAVPPDMTPKRIR